MVVINYDRTMAIFKLGMQLALRCVYHIYIGWVDNRLIKSKKPATVP
jgi:hypothetical protein